MMCDDCPNFGRCAGWMAKPWKGFSEVCPQMSWYADRIWNHGWGHAIVVRIHFHLLKGNWPPEISPHADTNIIITPLITSPRKTVIGWKARKDIYTDWQCHASFSLSLHPALASASWRRCRSDFLRFSHWIILFCLETLGSGRHVFLSIWESDFSIFARYVSQPGVEGWLIWLQDESAHQAICVSLFRSVRINHMARKLSHSVSVLIHGDQLNHWSSYWRNRKFMRAICCCHEIVPASSSTWMHHWAPESWFHCKLVQEKHRQSWERLDLILYAFTEKGDSFSLVVHATVVNCADVCRIQTTWNQTWLWCSLTLNSTSQSDCYVASKIFRWPAACFLAHG